MKHTQIRCDTISTAGQLARVVTRKNHIISTDIKITQQFDGAVYQFPPTDDVFDKYRSAPQQELGHIPVSYVGNDPQPVQVEINDFPVNKSINRMSFQPLSAQNAFWDSPRDRTLLLPYVTETKIKENNMFRLPTSLTVIQQGAYLEQDVLLWTDGNGDVEDQPNTARPFHYYPKIRGQLFVRRRNEEVYDDEKVGQSRTEYDESTIEHGLFETRFFDGNQHDYSKDDVCQLMTTTISQQIRDNVAGAHNFTGQEVLDARDDGLTGIPFVHQIVDGKEIFRTTCEDFVLRIRASYFNSTALPAPGGLYTAISGSYAFRLTYNLQLEFDESGRAITKAVNQAGDDITEDVRVGNFFKMVLWEKNYATFDDQSAQITLQGQAAAFLDVGAIPGSKLNQLILYLPIRRYQLTERKVSAAAVGAHPAVYAHYENDNLPELSSKGRNMLIEWLKESSDNHNTTQPEYKVGVGGSSETQLEMIRQRDRDSMNTVAEAGYRIGPVVPLSISEVPSGSFTPLWTVANATRVLDRYVIPINSVAGRNVQRIRTVVGTYVLQVQIHNKQTVAKTAAGADGWVLGNGNFIGSEEELSKMYVVFTNAAVAEDLVNNEMSISGATSYYIHAEDEGGTAVTCFKNAVTSGLLQAENAQGAEVAYDIGENRMIAPGEYIGDTTEIFMSRLFDNPDNQIGIAAGRAPRRISDTIHKTGYLAPLIDAFWTHTTTALHPDGTAVAYISDEFDNAPAHHDTEWEDDLSDVSQDWLAYFAQVTNNAAGQVDHRKKTLYEQIAILNNQYIPFLEEFDRGALDNNGQLRFGWEALKVGPYLDPATGAAWVPTALPDPLPAGYNIPAGYNAATNDYATFGGAGYAGAYVALLAGTDAFFLALEAMNTDDGLQAAMDTLTTGQVELISLQDAYVSQSEPKNIRRRAAIRGLELRENLFTIGGLTQFQPHAIYDPLVDFPALIQDFDLNTRDRTMEKYKGFCKTLSDNMVLELTPRNKYTLQIRTKNTFDQRNKSIQSVDVKVPNVKVFQKICPVVANSEYTVPFVTSIGPPTKVFIHMERVSTAGQPYDKYPPIIQTIQLKCINNNVESISTHDAYQVNEITRRNSNPRCNVRENRQNIGGVLLTRDDLCDWVDFDIFDNGWDTFKGDIIIKELNIIENDERLVDQLSEPCREAVSKQDRKIRVLFIYEDHTLTGQAGTMRFWDGTR
jgi:hypothetical protein